MKIKKQSVKMVIGFASVLLIGILLLTAVYALPTERIKEHVSESLFVLQREGEYPSQFKNMVACKMDNYTDALMLSTSAIGSDHPFKAAFRTSSYYTKTSGKGPIDALTEQMLGTGECKAKVRDYCWYWHGYVVILKPLLLFFNLHEIRVISQMVFGILFGVVLLLLWQKVNWKIAVSFFISMMMCCIYVVTYSLQLSNMVYLTLVGMFVLLLFYDYLEKKNAFFLFFLIMGMLTSYMDLLTAPLLVFGILLILKVVMGQGEQKFITTFLQGLSWGFGYLGMWAAKWTIGTLILKKNVFQLAGRKILQRTSGEAQGIDPHIANVLGRLGNLFADTYLKKPLIFVLILMALGIVISVILMQRQVLVNGRKFAVLLLISLSPFVWFMTLRNHTYIHYWFSYRSIAVTFFGILSYIACLSNKSNSNMGTL